MVIRCQKNGNHLLVLFPFWLWENTIFLLCGLLSHIANTTPHQTWNRCSSQKQPSSYAHTSLNLTSHYIMILFPSFCVISPQIQVVVLASFFGLNPSPPDISLVLQQGSMFWCDHVWLHIRYSNLPSITLWGSLDGFVFLSHLWILEVVLLHPWLM